MIIKYQLIGNIWLYLHFNFCHNLFLTKDIAFAFLPGRMKSHLEDGQESGNHAGTPFWTIHEKEGNFNAVKIKIGYSEFLKAL